MNDYLYDESYTRRALAYFDELAIKEGESK